MADRALVSIFFRQITVGRTSGRFAGTIFPRHIGQSGSRAGFHAFRFAVAEEALAGFLFFAVEAHHVPRTGLLAESAADALVFIHIVGAGLGIDVDGTLRAGIGAGDRVSALAARVLIDGAVAPDAPGKGRAPGLPGPYQILRPIRIRAKTGSFLPSLNSVQAISQRWQSTQRGIADD